MDSRSMVFQSFSIFLVLLICSSKVYCNSNIFNMVEYGAKADGKTDATQILLRTWSTACESVSGGIIIFPSGTFLIDTIRLEGPCKGEMVFINNGVIKASANPSIGTDYWILFNSVTGLTLSGNGIFDGQGSSAWSNNHCKNSNTCSKLPVSIKFNSVKRAKIHGIKSLNSKFFHFNFNNCEDVNMDGVTITAPKDSPNTDGIHIARSNHVQISNIQIFTGDDCISLGPGATNVNISRINCDAGHGISIGSLGKYLNEEDVSNIRVSDVYLRNTQNGVRIKTWAPSPPSKVSDIIFENIHVNDVSNPIIIDQLYCPYSSCSHQGDSKVQISNVKFINIRGTSATQISVDLQCSKSLPCHGLFFQDIGLTYNGGQNPTIASCSNVNANFQGQDFPSKCSVTRLL